MQSKLHDLYYKLVIILKYLFVLGALSGFLSTTFSFRGVTFVGGLLIGSGLCFSGLTSRPEMLFLTYSLLTGTTCEIDQILPNTSILV